MTSFYDIDDPFLRAFGRIGKNCLISRNSTFYGMSNIFIGDNVRIDDFCVVSGNITIGNNCHIACGVTIMGDVELCDYSNVSHKATILSKSDDFSGEFLIGPCSPEEERNVISCPIKIGKFAIIGAHSLLLPGAEMNYNTGLGAMSLLMSKTEPNSMYIGTPCRKVKDRIKPKESWQ